MLAALLGQNAVHEGDVLLLWQTLLLRVEVAGEDGTDLPAGATGLVGETGHALAEEEADVFLEGVGRHVGAVPGDLDGWADDGGKLHNSGAKAWNHLLTCA